MTIATCMMGGGGGRWASWNGSADGVNQSYGATGARITPKAIPLSETTFLALFMNSGDTEFQCAVGTVSGTTVSYGSAVLIQDNASNLPVLAFGILIDTNKVVVLYSTSGNGLKAHVITISGTTPTVGSFETITSNANAVFTSSRQACKISSTSVYVNYTRSDGNAYGVILSISGTTITVNSATSVVALNTSPSCVSYTTDKVLITYPGTSGYISAKIVNISGTSIGTLGSEVQIETVSTAAGDIGVTAMSTSTVMVGYGNSSALKAVLLSLSANTVTVNSLLNVVSSSAQYAYPEYLNDTEAMISYGLGGVQSQKAKIITVTDIVLTAGSQVEIQSSIDNTGWAIGRLSASAVVTAGRISNNLQTKILQP